MQIRRRSEFVFQPRLDARVELVGLEPGPDHRHARRGRDSDEIFARTLALRDEHARNRIGKERREMLAAYVAIDRLEIRDLRLAQHLKTAGGKPPNIPG